MLIWKKCEFLSIFAKKAEYFQIYWNLCQFIPIFPRFSTHFSYLYRPNSANRHTNPHFRPKNKDLPPKSEKKPENPQFSWKLPPYLLPPKPPIFSQNNSPSILPGQRIILHNHQALAVGFAGLIHVNSTCCLLYHFNCLWHLIQLWDLEYFATLATVYPSVRGTAIKQPSTATFRALGDNLHQHIPYTNSRILKRNTIRN